MQLCKSTRIWLVGPDGLSGPQSFESVLTAVVGGLTLDDHEIFTDLEDARTAGAAQDRRKRVRQFDRTDMLRASKLVLLDQDGATIDEITFCPTDH